MELGIPHLFCDLLGTLSSRRKSFIQTSYSKMSEVTFSYGQKKKRIVLSGKESESALQQELSLAFSLPPNTEIAGFKDLGSGRVYSFAELLARPDTFANSEALIVVDRIGCFWCLL